MSKDTIYREDVIKAVNAMTNWYQVTCNGKQIAVMLMAKDVNEILQKVPSANRPQGEWILLNEKVPEMDERVIVIDNGYEYHVWDCMSNRGDEYFWEDEEGLYHNKYEVVAWLPFPLPFPEAIL